MVQWLGEWTSCTKVLGSELAKVLKFFSSKTLLIHTDKSITHSRLARIGVFILDERSRVTVDRYIFKFFFGNTQNNEIRLVHSVWRCHHCVHETWLAVSILSKIKQECSPALCRTTPNSLIIFLENVWPNISRFLLFEHVLLMVSVFVNSPIYKLLTLIVLTSLKSSQGRGGTSKNQNITKINHVSILNFLKADIYWNWNW